MGATATSFPERWVTVGAIPNGEASLAEYRGLFGEEWVETRQNEAGRLEVRLKRFDEYAGRVGEPGRFLVLQGEEITDRFESRPLHLNATNVAGFIPPQGGTSVADVLQRNIAAVLEQRRATEQPMFPHVNHPNFGWAVTAEDLMDLDGERFFEVYNGHPLVHNAGDSLHPSTERIWDIVLTHRLTRGLDVVYGLAVDDAHHYELMDSTRANPARGWVMVRATALAPEAIVAAMEAGEFYASTGVVLADIEWSESGVALRIAGEPGVTYLTEFVGTRAGFDREVREVPDVGGLPVTRRYSADIGTVLAEVPGLNPAYAFTGDEIYVRARVRSSQPVDHPVHAGEVQMAWVQPVVVGSGGR
ncbi:MAG: histidinol-phosphatase [Gemmatimonadetes bacterium]|nr:histidinol-phosphatase [Gemmatimonadota bacterium]